MQQRQNMKYQEYNVNQAKGIRLSEPVRLDGMVLPKGHELDDEDILQLKLSGIKRIFGAEMDENDLDNVTALGIISGKLCGANTAFATENSGISSIVADSDGIFVAADDRIAKFNRLAPEVILNTLPPYTPVKKGDTIAQLELTIPVISVERTDNIIFSLSGNTPLLSVMQPQQQKAALLYTKFYNDNAETVHLTAVVTKLVKQFQLLELGFGAEYQAPHEVEKIADALEAALKSDAQVVFIISGRRNSCQDDTVATAVRSVADEVAAYAIPQTGASDLLIAGKRDKKIIMLPFNYDSTNSALADHYIKLALVNEKISPADFKHPQNIRLNPGQKFNGDADADLIRANIKTKPGSANVAAVILAAGVGRRTGRNKLLYDVEGEPLFLRAVRAAVRSQASPVFVITGDHAAELEEALEDVDVNIIYNSGYRSGLRTSIALGVKSVPGFCDGVLLLPADMPNITPEFINKMIKNFDNKAEKQLVIAAVKGIKCNPAIWSKSLYDVADLVPENADLRPVFMEHSDYTKLVKGDENILLDVNYPYDLERLGK